MKRVHFVRRERCFEVLPVITLDYWETDCFVIYLAWLVFTISIVIKSPEEL